MNYKVDWIDWFQSDISLTNEEVDNEEVFKTFTEAKENLLTSIMGYKLDMNRQLKRIRNLKKSDVF